MAFQADAFQNDAFQVVVSGYEAAGAATFAMLVEEGAQVTYSWQTDIIKAFSGLEQRAACLALPRQRYDFSTILEDAQWRGVLSTLAAETAAAPLFLLGLAYEALPVMSSTSSTIEVPSGALALCDWAVAGQRIAVRSASGTTLGEAVVQYAAGTTIGTDVDLSAIAKYGADVMPAVAVYLEADQGLARWPVNAGRWELAARAYRNRFATGAVVGNGATVNTYDSLPVWDWGIAAELAEQPLYTGAELVDLGGRIGMIGAFTEVDWGRTIRIESSARIDWQYLKKFLDTVQGRRKAFLLPSGRPDLVPVGDASSGTLTVVGPPVADAPDYVNDWFPSLAHRRLRLVKTDGSFAYRKVTACAAGGGTQDLALDSALAGALERVEFLEQVRLESDEVSVRWEGAAFEATMQARVVQR